MDAVQTVLISSFTAILVAYITARAASYSKDVIEDRQKWRERIRLLSIEAAKLIRDRQTQNSNYDALCAEFKLRLNPASNHDTAILKTLREGRANPTDLISGKLLAQVARLLKHDWERAKVEANWFGFIYPNENELRNLNSSDYMD